MNSSEFNRPHRASTRVDLVLTGAGPVLWRLGATLPVTLAAGSHCREHEILQTTSAQALLFWDSALGQPCAETVLKMLVGPSDLWHAGLCHGMRGLPGLVDFVNPTWMFNCDPSPAIEATSWRVSLRACLVRTEVLRKMGFLLPEFSTVEAAALEWGHRLLTRGVLMRHVPRLVGHSIKGPLTTDPGTTGLQDHGTTGPRDYGATGLRGHGTTGPRDHGTTGPRPLSALPFADELRFIYYRHGRKWAAWAIFRALMSRYTTLPTALRAWRFVMSSPRPADPPPFRASGASRPWSVVSSQSPGTPSSLLRPPSSGEGPVVSRSRGPEDPTVSVLIPTVDRYPYLRTLLDQLRRQTVPPFEVIVVDQTSSDRRDSAPASEFADLPLKWIWRDNAGQCSSRNAGLAASSGDFLLLLDDDVEVPPDLIEAHLNNLRRFGAAASSGVAEEMGAGSLKPENGHIRASDVFPAGNTMLTRAALEKTGLFDLAYEKGARADGDLGMRFYLSGAVMILNGEIQVLHHHAPSGGLRKHGARKITSASSRSRLSHRNLASLTEMYLARRYYSASQVGEALWLRALGTFRLRGNALRKTLKCLVSALSLPHTIYVMRKNRELARAMLTEFPKIPQLPPQPMPELSSGHQFVPSGSATPH